jgi:hypothetical protein
VKTECIKLAKIVTDAGTQVRADINPETVADYAEAMLDSTNKFPPVVVFNIGTDEYFLVDGFHRVASAKERKFNDIEAEIHNGTEQDAVWFALGANKRNGVRLTAGDKARAITIALKLFPDKTQEDIASQVGCSQGRVAQVKGELISVNKLPPPPPRKGKDKKTYPATYNKRELCDPASGTDCERLL